MSDALLVAIHQQLAEIQQGQAQTRAEQEADRESAREHRARTAETIAQLVQQIAVINARLADGDKHFERLDRNKAVDAATARANARWQKVLITIGATVISSVVAAAIWVGHWAITHGEAVFAAIQALFVPPKGH